MEDEMSGAEQEVAGVVIEQSEAPIEVGTQVEETFDQSDPRAAIYAKHKEQRQEEAGTPSEPEPNPAPDQAPGDPPPDEEIVIKVNGRERRVARSRVEAAGGIDAYQKNAAASELLNQATAERRRIAEEAAELENRRRFLIEQERKLATQPNKAEAPPAAADELKPLARKYHEAIMNGDMDEADELLIKLQSAQKTATPDETKIVRKAVAETRAEIQRDHQREVVAAFNREHQAALAEFPDRYPDLVSDPDLLEMANQKTIKLMREYPGATPTAVIDEAARQVRDWMKEKGIVKEVPVTSGRLEAKRALTPIRGASARSAPKPAPKPKTHSQYIEGLRKARGLE